MIFKNCEIMDIAETICNVYNKTKDIKLKWSLANMSDSFLNKKSMIHIEINSIIEQEGITDESGKKEIRTSNEHYLELMNCETEIQFTPIPLKQFENSEISITEMQILRKVIDNE